MVEDFIIQSEGGILDNEKSFHKSQAKTQNTDSPFISLRTVGRYLNNWWY
jgi:hypothetical protein